MMQSSSSLADMMQERSSLSSSFKKQKTIQTTTIPKTRSQRRLNRRGKATNTTKAMMMMMKSSGGGEDVGGEKTSSSSSLESSSKTLMLTTTNSTTNSTKTNKRGFMQKRKATMGNGGLRVSAATAMDSFSKFSALFSNLFPLWTVLSAALALTKPAFFNFMTTPMITFCLALLMFSMGITLTIDDFLRVFKKPDVIGLGFLYCYVAMPALAFVIGNAIGLSGPLLAGLILVGSINGGQASNLCAYIAKGDVALSVLMTTATTIGCIFMTPLICKLALGAIVDVNAIGMAISTIKVVLVPVVLGVTLNKVTPKTCRTVEPFCPIVGVIMTVILVGGSVAQCAEGILNAGMKLQVGAFLLHLLGGALGYWGMKIFKYSETTCRTCAIETAMKSSAFGFLLASLHFPEFLVRVPSAVSVVWMAIMGSMMAVIWRFIPVEDE
jgi:BASS family bile acid:Na+ symporter